MIVSIFQNFNEVSEDLALPAVLDHIQNGRYREQIENLRALLLQGKKDEYKSRKKSLPAFTTSATFMGGRKMEFLQEYTGIVILDFDEIPDNQLLILKSTASAIPFTLACFISPSNNGLKILIQTDAKLENHEAVFNELKMVYEDLLNFPIDPSGKDVTRLCFFSYDPELYFNSSSETFSTRTTMIDNDINNVVNQLEQHQIDLTNDYKDWLNIGFALADALSEGGREYFHRISQLSTKYEKSSCDNQFDKCVKSKNSGVSAKTLFYLAKQHGIDISPVKSFDLTEKEANPPVVQIEDPAKKKKKKNVIDQIEQYLSSCTTMRYNIVSGIIEVKNTITEEFMPLDDYLENSMLRALLKNNIPCNTTRLKSIIHSNYSKKYDPFKEYFNQLPPWDGETDYILQLSQTISATDNQFWQNCFKKWLVASVASLLTPKIVNHTAIIFSGPQGIGKTTWMENLCPSALRSYLFSGTINPTNKDTLIQLTECWFINMDELENMNRTEIGTLKEVITKSAIRTRRAYGRNNETLPRRASFMGSVNTSQFLNDSTGSRRFLCFEVVDIDYSNQVEIDKVYSQASALFHQGFKYYFDKNEIGEITANNEQYQVKTIEEELLLTWFRKPEPNETPIYLPTSQILHKLTIYSKITTTTGNVITLGKALKKHNFQRIKKKGNYVYSVIELTQDQVERENRIAPEPEGDHSQSSDKQDNDVIDDLPF
ncbi:MAG: VapE domain-containing protein [Bacteroidota bacterium]